MPNRNSWPMFAALAASALVIALVLRRPMAAKLREPVAALPSVEAAESQASTRPAVLETPVVPTPEEPKPGSTESPATDSARAEAPVARPAWVEEILSSSTESWSARKQRMTRDERNALREKIYDYFNQDSKDEFARMREAREWEVLVPPGEPMTYHGTDEDDHLIYNVVMSQQDGVCKLVLSRERFPELYALKEKADALQKLN